MTEKKKHPQKRTQGQRNMRAHVAASRNHSNKGVGFPGILRNVKKKKNKGKK